MGKIYPFGPSHGLCLAPTPPCNGWSLGGKILIPFTRSMGNSSDVLQQWAINFIWVCTPLYATKITVYTTKQSPDFLVLMTSSNGNIFHVTGPLCGEFTGSRWIPRTRPVTRSLVFSLICAWINGWVNNSEAGDLRRYRTHYDVTVMVTGCRCIKREVKCMQKSYLKQ